MFEKGRKYILSTAFVLLMVTGFVAAIRPGITLPVNVPSDVTLETGNVTTTTLEKPIVTKPPQLIGGQTDEHGCLAAAGVSWNETASKCMRPWNGDIHLTSGTMLVNTSDPNWREKLQASIPISTDVKCVSSNGDDIFTKRTVMEYGKNPKKSSCIRHRFLRTWACSGDVAVQKLIICKKGCSNEACRPEITTTTTTLPVITGVGVSGNGGGTQSPPTTLPSVPTNSTI